MSTPPQQKQMIHCEGPLPHHDLPPQLSPTSTTSFKPTVLTPATAYSTDCSNSFSDSFSETPTSTSFQSTVRVPLPSPSRPRVDPQYAARLEKLQVNTTASPDIMPPPPVYRVESPMFTPTSIFRDSPRRPPAKKVRAEPNDRFIPCRTVKTTDANNLWHTRKGGMTDDEIASAESQRPMYFGSFAGNTQQNLLRSLLQTEVLGEHNENPTRPTPNYLRFSGSRNALQERMMDPTEVVNSFNLTPVSSVSSDRLSSVPAKRKRRISKVPFKVLDAPALQDDFYLNLVDWSSQNVLAVGLGSCVYLWSAATSKVTKLCDLSTAEDTVTSVAWAQRGTHLSVGTGKGEVQLWDAVKGKKVRTMTGHSARVGTLSWSGPILASGSRDRLIFFRDVRVQSQYTDKLSNHRQEVCGLRWSFEEPAFLASGGNDNNLHVIDSRKPSDPLHKFSDHTAAVKAIAWSPHQHGLLASGGGTADRCIRFWNTLSGARLNKIDTGSQVCNLAWSQNCNEIVSTHGYSFNQIIVWRYPSMSKVTTLTGHTTRVLYLAMSPDGSTVVTGAGDETLRFWQIFPGPRSDGKDRSGGLLFPNTIGSVIR